MVQPIVIGQSYIWYGKLTEQMKGIIEAVLTMSLLEIEGNIIE